MGSDLSVPDVARVSYDKIAENYTDKQNYGLINFLVRENHTSPFRHQILQFEVYAPLMVMRQWGKYRVGSAWLFEGGDDPIETWNESSRRYVTEEPEFYIPEVWRSAPENSKQGSGEPVDSETAKYNTYELTKQIETAMYSYKSALAEGTAPEQARLFLPAYAMYVRAIWTVSLQGVLHFLQQRLEEYSQWEIQEYARAVRDLAQPLFPESFKAFAMYKESE